MACWFRLAVVIGRESVVEEPAVCGTVVVAIGIGYVQGWKPVVEHVRWQAWLSYQNALMGDTWDTSS